MDQSPQKAIKRTTEVKDEEDEEDEEDEYDINVQDHLSADCPGWYACLMLELTVSDEVEQEEAPDVVEPAQLPRFYESEI